MARGSRRQSKTNRKSTHYDFNDYPDLSPVQLELAARREGPKRKTWSKHDLKCIQALTPTQHDFIHSFINGDHILAHGCPGTGKSYIGLYLALSELLDQRSDIEKIIIVRSVVPTRQIGFLPGTLEEKYAPYELPYKDIFADLLGRDSTYDDMKAAGVVEFVTSSFLRGLTWDNCIVVVDEGQNLSSHETNSIVTRLGKNSRLLFLGDLDQTDLQGGEKTGMDSMIKIVADMKDFSVIRFTEHDIVRSEFVKSWIKARNKYLGLNNK